MNMSCIPGMCCCFIVSHGESAVWKSSQYSSVFCIMPHFRLIVLHTPIWGLNCILHHYFRFILKGIFAQTHSVILILVGVRHRRKNLPQTGDFTVSPAIAKCEKVLIRRIQVIQYFLVEELQFMMVHYESFRCPRFIFNVLSQMQI